MKEHTLLWSAIHELKIDVPIMRYEVKGEKIILHLYGGQVVTYTPATTVAPSHEQSASPSLPGKGAGVRSKPAAVKPKAKTIGGAPQ
jgi:hypothetical protein